MNAAPRLAIVICAYHREALLAQALASIAGQARPANLDVSVVVVDNSDDHSAAGVVARSASASPWPTRCLTAHPANISVARNVGVAAAQAEWIAFVDDDQQLQPGWLEAVAKAIADFPHDVFFGAVEGVFERPEAAGAAARQLFSRALDAEAGRELFAMGPDKTPGVALATNNSVFRRAAMTFDRQVFDPAFGRGGGEDYDLLCRMQRRGARFAWLPGARAREFVPAARCAPAYLRRRFYAGGQAYAAAAAGASARPELARWLLRAKATAQAAILVAQTPFLALRGGDALIEHSYRLAGALGKMSFGAIAPIYQRTAARDAA